MVLVILFELGNLLNHFRFNFGCVWRTGSQDDLDPRIKMSNGMQKVNDSLLSGDSPHKQDIGDFRVYPIASQDGLVKRRLILLQVNSIGDHMNSPATDSIERHNVFFHLR